MIPGSNGFRSSQNVSSYIPSCICLPSQFLFHILRQQELQHPKQAVRQFISLCNELDSSAGISAKGLIMGPLLIMEAKASSPAGVCPALEISFNCLGWYFKARQRATAQRFSGSFTLGRATTSCWNAGGPIDALRRRAKAASVRPLSRAAN